MSKAVVTTDHDEIRRWVETRGGFPARVKGTGSKRGDAGLLRIDYPGFSGTESLEKISWDAWFSTFDDEDLAFLAQDVIGRGKTSRFSKLVARTTAMESKRGARAGSRRNGAKKKAASARGKTSAKRASAKRATAKRTTAKRTTAKRTTAKRTTAKRPVEKAAAASSTARRRGASGTRGRAKTSARRTTKRTSRAASA